MPPLPLLVFTVGTGSLGAEIAAVRLLSPYFGASTIVWANTIGIVLVALSIGYWLGGRWADRNPTMRGLCLLALTAAGLLAIVPFAADPLLDVAVSALDSISAGAFLGSLIGRARPGGGARAAARRRLALRGAPGRAHRGGGGRGGRPAVRALHRREPGGHAALGAAVHPADRHAPHVPGVRAGHRRGGGGRACARCAATRSRRPRSSR